MRRHHRDRDMLWLTSGLPFLTWAADSAAGEARRATPISEGPTPCRPANEDLRHSADWCPARD